jgi:hypothetical protein
MEPLSRSTHVEQIERLEARVAVLTAALTEIRERFPIEPWEWMVRTFSVEDVRRIDAALDAAAGGA